jgi:hypothetical protein
MKPGETQEQAAARYVGPHKLGVNPSVFLALANAQHVGKIHFISWMHDAPRQNQNL